MFWSDTMTHTIHQADLNGENETTLVSTDIRGVGRLKDFYIKLKMDVSSASFCFIDDIAVDWIASNLYWVDSVWARIEALSLDTMERTEILRAGTNTRPRAIAVDPINRYIHIAYKY